MPLTAVLAVGLDSWIETPQRSVWQFAGYIFTFAILMSETISRFRRGGFHEVRVTLHSRSKAGKS
jgi:hypothetical protein